MPNVMKEIDSLTSKQIMHKIKCAMTEIRMAKKNDHWMFTERLGGFEDHVGWSKRGINIFDYAPETKASLSPMTSPEDEWYEVELTADTGACDTVVPKLICPGIPITPSVQSLRGMEYVVATGQSIPNLGEKRCKMWAEGIPGPQSRLACMRPMPKRHFSASADAQTWARVLVWSRIRVST